MADAGFDVWLPNSRGTTYSRKHARLNPDDPFSGYWNFSWTEMGIYDHPAVIDYVLMRTESKTMNFIGHSQGTTSLLVLLSMKPEYNEKISIASLMAPIAYLKHTQPLQKKYFSAFLLLWVNTIYLTVSGKIMTFQFNFILASEKYRISPAVISSRAIEQNSLPRRTYNWYLWFRIE